MTNILDYLEMTAERTSWKTGVDDGRVCMSWRELMELSRRIGTAFSKRTQPGKPVVILMEKSAITLAAMFGAVYAGCFYTVIDPAQPEGRIREILEQLEPEIILVDRDEASVGDAGLYQEKKVLLKDCLHEEIDMGVLRRIRRAGTKDDLLYCLFTSGSSGKPKGVAVSHREDLDVLCTAIREMKWKGRVTLEMGRYLAAPAGYYLTGVRDIKRNHQKNYCIVDGGIHQLHYDGQIKGMYYPHLQVSPQREPGDLQEWTICGSLCTENDVLVTNLHIQGLKYGDILIFHRAGAYAMTEGMALFLSHSLPKAATYSKQKGWRLIRAEQPTFLWNMEWNIEKESDDGDIDRSFRGNR